MTTFINVADIPDPNDPEGRTYRQINATKKHNIPIGTLVELDTGVRLFVVHQARDCDQEPIYYLSHCKNDTVQRNLALRNESWVGGYGEESLTVVPRND